MVCCTSDSNKQNIINLEKFIVAKLGGKFPDYFTNIKFITILCPLANR